MNPISIVLWAVITLISWVQPVESFDPGAIELRFLFLVGNIPQNLIDSITSSPATDVNLYDYINYSNTFKRQVDKYGYIIGINEIKWHEITRQFLMESESELELESEPASASASESKSQSVLGGAFYQQIWPLIYHHYNRIKHQSFRKFKLIKHIVKRQNTYNVYLIVFNQVEYLLVVDNKCGYTYDDLVYYVNSFQLGSLGEGSDCWVNNIDYLNVVKFVRVGINPWDECTNTD